VIHNNRQQHTSKLIDPDFTTGDSTKTLTQAKICQRYFWDGSVWKKFDHSNPIAPSHTTVDGTGVVDPTFQVRAMKVEGSGHWVKHDLIDQGMVYTREQYAVEVLHPCHVSRLWLDREHAQTNCDAVTLYG